VGPDSEYGWLQGYTKELYGWVIDATSQQLQQQQVQYMIRRMRSLFELGGDILPPTFLTADPTAHTIDEDGKAACSGQSESPSDEAESKTTTTGEIDPSSSCISKNDTQLLSPSSESFTMPNHPLITSMTEETTIETTTEQTVQIESATLTDDIQASIPNYTSELRVSENALVLEEDGTTSMLQSSRESDEINKASSTPSLPASSSVLQLNSSSQEDLVQLLEKANMKIAHLEQSNSALSKKCQEVQIKLVDQKVIMEELQSSFQKRLEQCGELSHEKRNLFSSLEKAMAENKELQKLNATLLKTDYERMKADSEMMHRMGNSLEGELSKSTREVLEHKQKRLEAKQELMSMLKKLEAEQRSCKELKEKIKFSFTPKAISQQKLLNESIESLESTLLRLSRRLGKPLPQRISAKAATDISEEVRPILNGSNGGSKDLRGINKSVNNAAAAAGGKLLEWDTSRLLQILEDETQQVSQSIMMLTSSVDRIYMLLDNPVGERSCVSSFADILSGRQPNGNSSAEDHPVESSRVSGRWPRSLR
jgi:myosin heavy subunit